MSIEKTFQCRQRLAADSDRVRILAIDQIGD
jgi:hypothetical protein